MTRDVTQRVRVGHVHHIHDLNAVCEMKEDHKIISKATAGSKQQYETKQGIHITS